MKRSHLLPIPGLGTWEKKTCLRNGCAQLESVRLWAEGLEARNPSHTLEDRGLRGLGACFNSVILPVLLVKVTLGPEKLAANPSSRAVPPQLGAPPPVEGRAGMWGLGSTCPFQQLSILSYFTRH